ncbi:MAG: pyridoxal phosphate-dependent aminotransferase [Gammaproteobacteria bacterium]
MRHPPLPRPAIAALPVSKIRAVANAALGKPGVLPFWFGESDRVTPDHVRAAAIASLDAGETFYTHNFGVPELRDALSSYLQVLHGHPIARDRIIVTSAGISGLMIAMQAILSPGDRVVVLAPTWPSLTEIPSILGAVTHRVGLTATPDGFALALDDLLSAITPDTRLVLLNSPANPTGWTIDPEHRAPILDRCREVGAWLICDDVYERLLINSSDAVAPSFLPLIDEADRVISVNSFSKAWAMTGWRLGWMVAPAAMAPELGKLLEFNTSCAPGFVQAGGLAALAHGARHGEPDLQAFRARLNTQAGRLTAGLKTLSGIFAPPPAGGMYRFVNIEGCPESLTTATRLIDEAGLGLAPGAAFGPAGEGWLRWCFASTPERLDEGIERLAGWLARR